MKKTNRKYYWRAVLSFLLGNIMCFTVEYLSFKDKNYTDNLIGYGIMVGILILVAFLTTSVLKRPMKKYASMEFVAYTAQYFSLFAGAMLLGVILPLRNLHQYELVAIVVLPIFIAMITIFLFIKLFIWCGDSLEPYIKATKHTLMLNPEIQYMVYRWKFFKESMLLQNFGKSDINENLVEKTNKTKAKAKTKKKKRRKK